MQIVDSLIVTLGLDPSAFEKGQKKAVEALIKTRGEASKTNKEIESTGKTAGEALDTMARKALALFAIFAGARSIKDFAEQLVTADSALGRLAGNIGTSANTLGAMANAVEANGGSASAAAASFQKLSDSFEEIKITGNSSIIPMLQRLQGMSGVAIDFQHGFERALPGIADALAALRKKDPTEANFMARQIGLDPGTANLLQQGGAAFRKATDDARKNAPNAQQTEAAAKLQQSWIHLTQAASHLGDILVEHLGPALTRILDAISAFIEKNPEVSIAIAATFSAISGFFILLTGAKMAAAILGIFKLQAALVGLGTEGTASLAPLLLSLGQLLGFMGLIAASPVIGDWLKGQFDKGFDAVSPGETTPEMLKNRNMSMWDRTKQIYRRMRGLPIDGEGGASGSGNDAIRRRSRHGGGTVRDTTNYTGSNAQALTQAAAQLGTSPHDLAMVMAYETRGTFSPSIHGGTGNNYQGLIQFGPSERRQFGANDRQSFKEQLPAVVSYLKTRGFKPGMGLADLYSTINAGSPGHYNASDGHGTVLSHVARMRSEREKDVQRFLGSKDAVPGTFSIDQTPYHAAIAAVKEAARPTPSVYGDLRGAHASLAGRSNVSNDNRSQHETSIGSVVIHTQATDAPGIAKSIKPALANHSFATHANSGPS